MKTREITWSVFKINWNFCLKSSSSFTSRIKGKNTQDLDPQGPDPHLQSHVVTLSMHLPCLYHMEEQQS